jgi:signal transduction histidine kinase
MPDELEDLTLEGLLHDLNNVFQTILEATDLLAVNPKTRAVAATIHRNVERGRRLVMSVHATSGAFFDFELILNSAIEFANDYQDAAHGHAIRFKNEVEPGLRLKGNPVAWERLLVNLFLNAAQAAGGPVTIEVTARRTPQGLHLEVADDGPGIPDDILPKIFRARFSTKKKARGSGLGLHIVESVVRENGGTVTAARRPAQAGALFTIRLPLPESPSGN